MSFLKVFAKQALRAYYSWSVLFKKQLNPQTFFPRWKQILVLIHSGPTLDILVKVFQFGVFCCKKVRVTALWFKPDISQSNSAIGRKRESDDILKVAFVLNRHRWLRPSCKD